MVPTRETVQAFLRELESGLPLDRSEIGSLFSELFTTVQPTINLADYDPDSNTGATGAAANNFGEFGDVIAIEAGAATLTSAGAQTHTYVIETGGIPAGQVHVVRNLGLLCDAGASEDWTLTLAGFGIAGPPTVDVRAGVIRCDNTGEVDLLAAVEDLGTPVPRGVQSRRPIIMYPLSTLTIRSNTTLAAGVISKLSLVRERYNTALVVADVSADIDASVI